MASSPESLFHSSISGATQGCPEPSAVCGAFAGLLTKVQKNSAESFLKSLFPAANVVAVPDYEAALVACGDTIDVCVLAGTGSLVCSFGPGKQLFRSGGRGFLLGDEGSAFQYGRDALMHYLDGPPDDISSELHSAVTAAFGTAKKNDIVVSLYQCEDPAKRIASLAEAFARDAIRQSLYALKSLRINSAKLAHVVSKHIRQYHPALKTVRIGCQGGLWSSAVFREPFTEQLVFWCKVEELEVDYDPPAPVFGAAEIAEGLLR